MKRKVKSAADLKRLALQTGAAVEMGSARFNTSMERARPEPTTPPTPPVVVVAPVESPPPAPAPVPQVTEQIQVNLDMAPVADAVNKGNERITEVITESLKQLHVPASGQKPCSWIFTIKRDTRGFIESVEANPKQ